MPFLAAAGLKLIHDICQFIGPVMLNKVTTFLEDTEAPKSDGYKYALIMFVAALLQSLCLRNYFYLCFRTGLRLRSSCITMVYWIIARFICRYNKALRLSSSARSQFNQGEIMNLMEVDSQKFQDITS